MVEDRTEWEHDASVAQEFLVRSRAVWVLSVLGAPLLLIALTDGWGHLGFWVETWYMVPLVGFGVGLAAIPFWGILWMLTTPLRMVFLWLRRGRPVVLSNRAQVRLMLAGFLPFYLGGIYGLIQSYEIPPDLVLPFGGGGSVLASLMIVTGGGVFAGVRYSKALRLESIRLTPPPPEPVRRPVEPVVHVPRTLPDWERRADPVVGWRVWWWDGAVLNGVYESWEAETKTAICQHQSHHAPHWACRCGIYAVNTVPADWMGLRHGVPVLGRVEIWGNVIEHDGGYRASDARITDLWAVTESLFVDLTVRYPEAVVWLGSPSDRRGEIEDG